MTHTKPVIMMSIEDIEYKEYLGDSLSEHFTIISTGREQIVQAIADHHPKIVVLQAEEAEDVLVEFARKLKRLFGDEIRIMLLSSDYCTESLAGYAVDKFLHFPVEAETLKNTLMELEKNTKKILLVDDSKLVHSVIVPPLKDCGYEVFEAYDGAEGLEQAKLHSPDLIISDIEMPRMNGFEMCSTIRRTPGISDCYIIMSSTLGSAADQQRGFQSGVDEYITKPVVIPELLDRIKKVFCSARTGRENVLLLVEQEAIAKNISKSLGKQGFSTQHVATMKQAVKLVKRLSFDLLISEMFLEDGTSMVDLIATLRSLPAEKQPDVLILTSRDNPGDEKMVRNAGAAGIISKPFTMDSLLAAVERTLSDRRAAQERTQIEKYMSKASRKIALEKAILGGKSASTRADKKTAAVFFSDIAGFTTRCEKYSPKEIVSQVNRLFEVMTKVIMENGGDIDKFIGDACVAFWLDDDPRLSASRAIRTLLELRKQLTTMNKEDPVLANDPIHIRVGVNMGEVILCDLGSADARIDLTVIGDAVNIAARLESASKQYGLTNLIGGPVLHSASTDLLTRPIDIVRVKGKSEPVECHELLGLIEQASDTEKELVSNFKEGFKLYTVGDFAGAKAAFAKSSALEVDAGGLNPSKLYIERCAQLMKKAPKDWDGTWKLDSK